MKTMFAKFNHDRRSAVAMIFALTLLPLVLLVALAIDFSFFTEARSQIQLAADAAATHAIRAAAGTYTLEVSENIGVSTATSDAIKAGETAGVDWFQAQLGLLPTATATPLTAGTASSSVPGVIVCPASSASACTSAATQGAGFYALVDYSGVYPPFFARLFNNANWAIGGTATAAAQYSYVEILMMLDTSASMLIGGTLSDIQGMEEDTICMPTSQVTTTDGDGPLITNAGSSGNKAGVAYPAYDPSPLDNTSSTNTDELPNGFTGIPNFTGNTINGSCNSNARQPGFAQSTAIKSSPTYYNAGGAGAPCAFACHNTTNMSGGYYTDLYGFARRNHQTLRLDQVVSSTEQVIQSMIDNEQTSDQYSVGVYQFNRTAGPLIPNSQNQGTTTQGTVGNPCSSCADPSTEATYDLPYVYNLIRNEADYTNNPSETVLPPLVPSPDDDGDTNFYGSMMQFESGLSNAAPQGDAGLSQAYPLKDIFIVTDGMEDECGGCGAPANGSIGGGSRVMGEMTSVGGELGNTTPGGLSAVCSLLKQKGFTVYVLYIDYLPVANYTFLNYWASSPGDNFTTSDFSQIVNPYATEQEMTDPMSYDFPTTGSLNLPSSTIGYPNAGFATTDSANETALRACAYDSATGESNLYTATDNSTSVATAMQQMLASALSGAITITN